jgi:hypothetical protein
LGKIYDSISNFELEIPQYFASFHMNFVLLKTVSIIYTCLKFRIMWKCSIAKTLSCKVTNIPSPPHTQRGPLAGQLPGQMLDKMQIIVLVPPLNL